MSRSRVPARALSRGTRSRGPVARRFPSRRRRRRSSSRGIRRCTCSGRRLLHRASRRTGRRCLNWRTWRSRRSPCHAPAGRRRRVRETRRRERRCRRRVHPARATALGRCSRPAGPRRRADDGSRKAGQRRGARCSPRSVNESENEARRHHAVRSSRPREPRFPVMVAPCRRESYRRRSPAPLGPIGSRGRARR